MVPVEGSKEASGKSHEISRTTAQNTTHGAEDVICDIEIYIQGEMKTVSHLTFNI